MHVENENIAADRDTFDGSADLTDFDAAVAELEAGTDTPADTAAANEPADSDTGASEDTAPADDAAAADDQPADGGDDRQAPADTGSPGGDTSEDIWAKADPKLREAYETMQRDFDLKLRTEKTRRAGVDRKVEELQRQITQNGQGGQSDTEQQPGGSDQGEKPQGTLTKEQIDQLREDYPDLAGPLLDAMQAQSDQIARLSKGVGQYEEAQTAEFLGQQAKILTDEHPDYLDVAGDERFEGWLDGQPQSVKQAFERNREYIVDGRDAALVIGRFKSDLGIGAKADPQPQGQGTSQQQPTEQDSKRQRQLAGNRDAGRSGPAATTGIPKDDFDAAAEYYLADKK